MMSGSSAMNRRAGAADFVRSRPVKAVSRSSILALMALCLSSTHAQSLSAGDIIEKAVSRAGRAEAASGHAAFSYTRATVVEEFDSSGKVKDRKEKVYEVVFQDGSSHLKLLKINGHPPTEADLAQFAANEASIRKELGDSKSKKPSRDNVLTAELVARFEFTLVGHQNLNGRDAYKLSFQPRNPEAAAHKVTDRLLNRLSGSIWIDAQEFELAQADVHLKSEVNLLGGVLGSLKKLAFTLTRTRVADGVWLNTSSIGDFEGRKLFGEMRIKTKTQSTNVRPLI